MQTDRYLKIVLTIIALELFWIGIREHAPALSAQGTPTAVIIQGIQIDGNGLLPVSIREARTPVPIDAPRPIAIQAERPLTIQADRALPVEAARPLRVEADPPLRVQSVPYTPSPRPGE